MLAKAVIDALEIEADVSNVTSTVRMLDLTNRSSDHIANRLDKELRYQAESLIIFNIGDQQSRGAPSPMWTRGLLKHIKTLRQNAPHSNIVCVFSCSFNENAIEFRNIEQYIRVCDISVAYNDGTLIFKSKNGDDVVQTNKDAIAAVFQETDKAKHDRLIHSITRQPGAFRFDDQSPVYPFRYSVSKNRSEIVDFVSSQIAQACVRENVTRVTYWSDESWFSQIVEYLNNSERLRGISFQRTRRDRMNGENETAYIHLIPFFGTGSDLTSSIDLASNKPASVVSIGRLIPDIETDEHRLQSKWLPLSFGKSILVEYFFAIPCTNSELVEVWREVDIAETQFHPSDVEQWTRGWQISPLSFWAMALESGFGREEYGPDRIKLENVPPMKSLVSSNGPYLAEKIIAFTEDVYGSPPNRSVIFVRIDEEGTAPLNEILGDAMDRVVISLPRKLLSAIDKNQIASLDELSALNGMAKLVEDFAISFDHALQEVGCTQPEQAKVVVLDEFVFSGKSMRLVSKLLKLRNINHCSRLALFNFGNEEGDKNANSLYHITLQ